MPRLGQRDFLPSSQKRRSQAIRERETSVSVANPGSNKVADFYDIQDALNAVNKIGGGSVLVNPGTYYIKKSLKVYGNTTLEGLTLNSCILDFGNTTFNIELEPDAFNININNLGIHNCRNTDGAIVGRGIVDLEMNWLEFINNKNGADIFFEKTTNNFCANIFINNCQSIKCNDFIAADSASQFANVSAIKNCSMESGTGYAAKNISQFSITGLDVRSLESTIVNSAFFGDFSFSTISNSTLLYDDNVTLSTYLADFNNTNNFRFINNFVNVDGSGFSGILDFNNSNNNVIAGNILLSGLGSSDDLIFLNNSSDFNAITGNYVDATDASGADALKITTGDQNVITGNSLYGGSAGTTYGVNVTDSDSDFNKIGNNILFGNTADTQDSGTSTSITDNV